MSIWVKAMRSLSPPVLVDLARLLTKSAREARPGQVSPPAAFEVPLSAELSRELIARMDRGDFDFDPSIVERMLAMWRYDNAQAPYPTVLRNAYSSGDAIAMNDKALMELSYQLPYSIAYEESQREKYNAFLGKAEDSGFNFAEATVLDVGCGLGGLLRVVHARHPSARLLAVECAHSAMRFIGEHSPSIHAMIADVEGDPVEFLSVVAEQPDVILMTEVLEHLRKPKHALRNLLALKPRQGIAISVPNGRADTAAQHIHFWSPESWRLFIEEAADGWRVSTGSCPSKGSPGGADNWAVLRPPMSPAGRSDT